MQALAKDQDRATNYLMREAIAQYAEREERRESLRPDVFKAWDTYQLTGRPVDRMDPEFREWLSGFWESGYVVLYRLEGELAVVLAIRHRREVGYG